MDFRPPEPAKFDQRNLRFRDQAGFDLARKIYQTPLIEVPVNRQIEHPAAPAGIE